MSHPLYSPSSHNPRWSGLLQNAVNQPGTILEAYTRFHGYSLGNRIAALFQCIARGIQPGPIATFPRWIELGRHVKRGEKALTLCQPVTVKDRDVADEPDAPEAMKTVFIWRPRWFVLTQTDGAEFIPPALPSWERERALQTLEVEIVPFAAMDGNIQGYASRRSVAINPLAQLPAKTLFHELAHVVLGHTKDAQTNDGADLPRDLREAEAEGVALLCLESLRLPGGEYCRGYIQSWLGAGRPIPEQSAQRIFKAADTILRAGTED
jgi:uncharacterized protein DUF955/antirestriction factor ArdC-like protein